MYKEIIRQENIQTLGNYTIVKSVEQTYWDNGRRFGRANTWYDICLDGGNGDIYESYDKLNAAKKRIKELDIYDKKQKCMEVDFENALENNMGTRGEIRKFYDNLSTKMIYKIYEEYYGKDE